MFIVLINFINITKKQIKNKFDSILITKINFDFLFLNNNCPGGIISFFFKDQSKTDEKEEQISHVRKSSSLSLDGKIVKIGRWMHFSEWTFALSRILL